MSEASQARPAAKRGGAAGILKRQVGPFHAWVWLAVVGGLVGWRVIAARTSAATSSTSSDATTSGAAGGTAGSTGGIYSGSYDASQVPQFINQTYTRVAAPPATVSVIPPSAPPMTTTPAPPAPASPTTTTSAAAPVTQFSGPTGVKVSNIGKSSATLSWQTSATSGTYPTSYTVALYNAKGTRLYEGTVSTPDDKGGVGTVTIPGLPTNTLVHGNVWPNGGKVAPKGANLSFHTTS
jgi:hypothetical protein